MNIKIDKNKPVTSSAKAGRPNIYPFDKLNVGDSFLSDKRCLSSAIAWCYRNQPEWKFASQKEGEKYRIGRIK